MDSMIENYLKGHGCPDKTKGIQHYIKDDSALKRRMITMAILVRSINNVGHKQKMLERMKDDSWLNYYFKYGSMAQKLIYTNH